ncbi:transferase [Streptomyces sp. NPDC016309]|uniref:transferase n=1 Tax=Streptomyces sp. NPDC016309 TaxID=3364965 RepID=UPI0036FC987B
MPAAQERGRIHPSAYIHPSAIIGDDVIIGPDVKVHEFTTVRKGSLLCAGAQVGFNCEVTAAFVGEDAVLGRRIGINRTILGARTHLSANVTVAAIKMTTDMRTPDREVITCTTTGLYRTGTTQFGAVIGDDTQTGNNISIGPGAAIGRCCQIASGVTLAIRTIPDNCMVTFPHTAAGLGIRHPCDDRRRRAPVPAFWSGAQARSTGPPPAVARRRSGHWEPTCRPLPAAW